MTETFQTPPALTPDYSFASTQDDKPWSAKGRFGRLSYLAWVMVLCFIVTGVVIAFAVVGAILGIHSIGSFVAIGLLLLIPFFYFMVVFQIRRLHDLNLTGWWVTLPLAGSIIVQVTTVLTHNVTFGLILTGVSFIISIIFTLYLMIAKGTEGTNDYGFQRSTSEWEKVLGWIYIVFSLIGLVAITFTAIPVYQNYQKRVAGMQHTTQASYQSTIETAPAAQ